MGTSMWCVIIILLLPVVTVSGSRIPYSESKTPAFDTSQLEPLKPEPEADAVVLKFEPRDQQTKPKIEQRPSDAHLNSEKPESTTNAESPCPTEGLVTPGTDPCAESDQADLTNQLDQPEQEDDKQPKTEPNIPQHGLFIKKLLPNSPKDVTDEDMPMRQKLEPKSPRNAAVKSEEPTAMSSGEELPPCTTESPETDPCAGVFDPSEVSTTDQDIKQQLIPNSGAYTLLQKLKPKDPEMEHAGEPKIPENMPVNSEKPAPMTTTESPCPTEGPESDPCDDTVQEDVPIESDQDSSSESTSTDQATTDKISTRARTTTDRFPCPTEATTEDPEANPCGEIDPEDTMTDGEEESIPVIRPGRPSDTPDNTESLTVSPRTTISSSDGSADPSETADDDRGDAYRITLGRLFKKRVWPNLVFKTRNSGRRTGNGLLKTMLEWMLKPRRGGRSADVKRTSNYGLFWEVRSSGQRMGNGKIWMRIGDVHDTAPSHDENDKMEDGDRKRTDKVHEIVKDGGEKKDESTQENVPEDAEYVSEERDASDTNRKSRPSSFGSKTSTMSSIDDETLATIRKSQGVTDDARSTPDVPTSTPEEQIKDGVMKTVGGLMKVMWGALKMMSDDQADT